MERCIVPLNETCQEGRNLESLDSLLDGIKTARSVTTDMALAELLGVSRATVSNWRHSRNLPDPVQCGRIADLAAVPLARVLGIVGEARAISREEKAVWKRLASAAALFMGLALASIVPTTGADAASRNRPTLYLTSRLNRVWRALRGTRDFAFA